METCNPQNHIWGLVGIYVSHQGEVRINREIWDEPEHGNEVGSTEVKGMSWSRIPAGLRGYTAW